MTRAAIGALLCLTCVAITRTAAAQDRGSGLAARYATAIDPSSLTGDQAIPLLDSLVNNASLVMLGEAWHGDGGAIRLRGALVEYLYRRHGFDAIIFEADFTSILGAVTPAHDGAGRQQAAADNIYPMWSRSGAAAPLMAFLAAHADGDRPIDVYGVDPRVTGRWADSVLVDSLLAWGRRSHSRAVSGIIPTIRAYLADEGGPAPDSATQRHVWSALSDLAAALAATRGDTAGSAQMVRSLRAGLEIAWLGANRDRRMGDNLQWLLANPLRGRRVILWAHNNHILKDKWAWFGSSDSLVREQVDRQSVDGVANFTYLGAEAYRILGPRVVSIGTLAASGKISPQIQTYITPFEADFGKTEPIPPASPEALEAVASRQPGPLSLVALEPLRLTGSELVSRALDLSRLPAVRLPLWLGFDAVFVLDRTIGLETPAAEAGLPP